MDHDHSYKLLFSHAEMVADLLRGFVHEDWVQQLDFTTLEKMGGSYVADDLRDREDDIVWRVRWGGEDWLYVYLLIEFQSTVDRFMAVRVLSYVGLLYQDLIRMELLTPDRHLPPVLPMVLYNGNKPWTAPEDIGDLIVPVPGGLERYRPSLRYLLLDENRYTESELGPLRNVVAALFRMENSRTPEDVARVLVALVEWLQAPEQQSLRRAFATWMKRVFLPGRMPGLDVHHVVDLQEVKSMLAERVVEWTKEWKWQGIQEGREQGREQGREEGREEGLHQGLQQGLRQGEASMLLRLMALKFGDVPEAVAERVRLADAETLLVWGERILTATRPEDVVGE